MAKSKANVAKLATETVEFTTTGRDDSTLDLQGLGQSLEALQQIEGHLVPTLPNAWKGRNEALFLSAGDAIAAFKNIQANNVQTMEFMRRAVRECLVIYGMHAEAEKRNAQPLTHAVYALNRKALFGHRGRDLAAKLIAWVEGCSAYRWRKDKATGTERFVCRKGEQIATSFSDRQRLVYDTHFDLYSKPVTKAEFKFDAALKRLLDKAEREGVAKEERAKIIALFQTGDAPETVVITGDAAVTIQTQRPALQAKVDTQANEAEAA